MAAAVVVLLYRCELDIVAQRYCNSVALPYASLLQTSGECIRVAIEYLICEDRALVVRNNAGDIHKLAPLSDSIESRLTHFGRQIVAQCQRSAQALSVRGAEAAVVSAVQALSKV